MPSQVWNKPEETELLGAIEDRFYVINATNWKVRRDTTNSERWNKLKAIVNGPQWIDGESVSDLD